MGGLKWLAAWMALPVLAVPVQGRTPSAASFTCAADHSFQVTYRARGRVAAVRTPTKEYLLDRKPGNLGQRFSSSQATLIIDGDFAAFVAEEAGEYSQCRSAALEPLPTKAVRPGR